MFQMVRKYKKRNILRNYSQEALDQALEEVRGGKLSIRAAAKKYNIPRSTTSENSVDGCSLGRPPALPTKVKDTLVSKAIDAANKGLGVSRLHMTTKAGM